VEAVTDEIGRSRYLISDGMSTVDGYQFIKIIGARAEILSGAKPTRIVGAVDQRCRQIRGDDGEA
jgi:hypothetical protein